MNKKLAIIGAGIAGLTLANRLSKLGNVDVEVFEKSRGIGGRMSTRTVGSYNFDHGTGSFSASDATFKDFLAELSTTHICQWQPKVIHFNQASYLPSEGYYVGTPKMNSLCKALLGDYTVHKLSKIVSLEKNTKWELTSESDEKFEDFDWVVLTAPITQTQKLLASCNKPIPFLKNLEPIQMLPCYTLLIGLNKVLDISYDIGLVEDGVIESIHNNARRPNAEGMQKTLVVHSSKQWAAEHMEYDSTEVSALMKKQLKSYIKLNDIEYEALHTWKYGFIDQPCTQRYLADETMALGVCGDGFIASGVEAAYRSAYFLAEYLEYQLA